MNTTLDSIDRRGLLIRTAIESFAFGAVLWIGMFFRAFTVPGSVDPTLHPLAITAYAVLVGPLAPFMAAVGTIYAASRLLRVIFDATDNGSR